MGAKVLVFDGLQLTTDRSGYTAVVIPGKSGGGTEGGLPDGCEANVVSLEALLLSRRDV